METLEIKVGAEGQLKETSTRGGSLGWASTGNFIYIGYVNGCGTNLYIFKSLSGGYEVTISARDFLLGEVHFTGSPNTQRENKRTRRRDSATPVNSEYYTLKLSGYSGSAKKSFKL